MPGMDITPVHGDMEDGDGVDTPDHTDTDTLFGAVRRGPPTTMMKNLSLVPMLMLMLMPGTDITAVHGDMEDGDGVDMPDHTDTDTLFGAVRRGPPTTMEKMQLDQMLILTMVTGELGGVAGEAMEDGVDTTDHGDTGEGSKRYSSLVGMKTWESLREDLALSTVNV